MTMGWHDWFYWFAVSLNIGFAAVNVEMGRRWRRLQRARLREMDEMLRAMRQALDAKLRPK
jgi:thiosulfate reductase cytochrome b subunit